MCGIGGILKINNEQISEADINKLVRCVSHRGPDDNGIWVSSQRNVALGHSRLSILDLSSESKQPMRSSDGRYLIVFNGEIYNFLEIRRELEDLGFSFKTESDTEVILVAFSVWGNEMLHKFNGMWAFAIYDTSTSKIFLSRDRFGVKPLYYYFENNTLIFSSEVQAIHKILGKDHPVEDSVLQSIANAQFSYYGTEKTYLKNVYSLPSGHNLEIIKSKIKIDKWYKLKKVKVPKSFEQQSVELKKLMVDSCKIRLRSDVSVGTCLSGGVDSGSIASVIYSLKNNENERFNKYAHHSFCAVFSGTPIDESKKAKKIADDLNINLDLINIESPPESEIVGVMNRMDGPWHSLAFFPIWKLYEHISKSGIKVTLDGQGPDEMLGGYRPLPEALSTAIQKMKPLWFIDVYKTYAAQGESNQFSAKKDAWKILLSLPFWNAKFILKKILGKCVAIDYPDFIKNKLDRSLYGQFFNNPLPGILQQYDRCSMAHGIECRMPFMDYRIVEFIFSLPVESKVGGGYTKRVLREAVKDVLDDEIRLNKEKIGFNAPIVDWFRNDLRDFMHNEMSKTDFIESKYFDGNKIKNDFDDFVKEPNPKWIEAWKFWGPVHVTWWLREVKRNI